MKKINGMDYLLGFGSIILFCSGIALMCNDIFNTYLIKTVGIASLGVILYILSFVFKYILNINKSFKIANILGSLSILIAYIMAGYNGIFGNWFSIDGEGVQIFLASIAFLVMILSILTAVLNKSYYYINITFIAILVGVFHLLTFFKLDYQISLIVIGLLLLFASLFKFNKFVYNFSTSAVFVYTLLCIIFGFDNNFLLGSIVLGINLACLLSVLAKSKSIWIEIFSTIAFITLLGFFTEYDVNAGLLVVITTFIVCIFELACNTFKLIKNNVINIISKLICFLLLVSMAYEAENMLVSQVVVFSFLLITSIANAYIIKHEPMEKYLLPIKLTFIIYGLYEVLMPYLNVQISEIYLFVVCSLLFMIIYKILNKKKCKEKIGYLIINIIWIICLTACSDEGVLEFILANLVVFTNYLIFDHKDNVVLNRLFYTFIAFLLLAISSYSSLSIIPIVLQIGIVAILGFINRKDKYNFVITMLILYSLFIDLIDFAIVNGSLADIVSSIFFLTLVGISSEVLFTKVTHKNVFTGILITLDLLMLMEQNQVFIVNIYSLIVSLIIILISLKNDNYKALYYIGLILGALNLVSLISFLDGLPVAVYLLIIAVVLIVVVSIMVYKYQHREIKEEKIVNRPINTSINYCGECGNKLNHDEKYCGNCGAKVK